MTTCAHLLTYQVANRLPLLRPSTSCFCLSCLCCCTRSLQQSSGSHIMVDQNFPEGQDRMVIIKGQRESVTRAASMITELIAGEPGSASAIISKVGVQ